MMKRLVALASICGAVLSSAITLAATPTFDPPLPPDIGQYESLQSTCTLVATDTHPEKTLVMDIYQREDDATSTIITISMNGEKITQRQYGYDDLFQVTYFIFVKNSPDMNWIKFGADELIEANLQLQSELGLTGEELLSCNGR